METEAWNFFEDFLPPEVAEIVFSFLSLEDIVYVSLVCKTWNTYFDTKDIWKKIIEHYYGELSPKNVDLTQSFRWKRIFIILHNAHSWAKTLKGTIMTYLSQRESIGKAHIDSNGQYIHTLTHWIEIKMAGKLAQVKRDPVTIDEKSWIPKRWYHPLENCVLASRNCKYIIRGENEYYFVDGEKLSSLDVGDYEAIRLEYGRAAFNRVPKQLTAHYATFNSQFAVLLEDRPLNDYGDIPIAIFNLQGHCYFCAATFYKPPTQRYNRGYAKCKDILLFTAHGAIAAFASELNPDQIVFFIRELDQERSTAQEYVYYPKMVIWKNGKGLQDEKSVPFKNIFTENPAITNFSEHVIDGHHWLCFDMRNNTRIIDLNNFANQYKLDLIPHRMWIPKKNKIILASDKKITVFDLSMNRWTSRMTCQNTVCAMTLNKSARILLVADNEKVHVYHWETGKLIGSVQHKQHHNFMSIDTLHIAYDQVLILNGKLFLKMPSKCDM